MAAIEHKAQGPAPTAASYRLAPRWVARGLRAVYLPTMAVRAEGSVPYIRVTPSADGGIAEATEGWENVGGHAGPGNYKADHGISAYGNTFFVVANLNSVAGRDCIALGRARYNNVQQVGCALRFGGTFNENLQISWAYYEYWWQYAYVDYGVQTGRHSYAGSIKRRSAASTARLYRDGVLQTLAGSSLGGGDGSIDQYDGAIDIGKTSASGETVIVDGIDGGIEFAAHFVCTSDDDTVLTDDEIAEIDANPWILLEPLVLEVPAAAAGGTTSVAVDIEQDFAVRNAVTVDVSGGFSVANTVTADIAQDFAVRNAVTVDIAQSFAVINTAALDIVQDFAVRNAVSVDIEGGFALRNAVTLDIAQDFAVRNAVTADIEGGFAVVNAVTLDIVQGFAVEETGSVTLDIVQGFAVRNEVSADIAQDFAVRNSAIVDIGGDFAVRSAASLDIEQSFAVINSVTLELEQGFAVRNALTKDIPQGFRVGDATTGDCPTAEAIVDALMGRLVEDGVDYLAALRVLLAAASGRTQGAGTVQEQFLSVDGVKPRITTTFDGNGNRQTVVLDGS